MMEGDKFDLFFSRLEIIFLPSSVFGLHQPHQLPDADGDAKNESEQCKKDERSQRLIHDKTNDPRDDHTRSNCDYSGRPTEGNSNR